MKRIGILCVAILLCAFTVMAQNTSQQQQKNAAARDENAAARAKAEASSANSDSAQEHDKAVARLDDAGAIIYQLLAAPDNGIPKEVLENAKCVAVIPSMIKGGFIFGAEYGRGVATCHTANGWSAPAFFSAVGGSWGLQVGGQATDLVMLIMNQNGMNQLLDSNFKIGGTVSAAAGPVGRQASASTNWKLRSEVLTYSRARGLFAGATLNGVVLKEDQDATRGYYGRDVGFRPVLTGQVKAPVSSDKFLAAVRNAQAEATAS